jgi:ABC-type transport system involved in multi-copper enzyme maturation permease subunit
MPSGQQARGRAEAISVSATAAPYRSQLPVGRGGFGQLLHAEWTKFRTVRGWVITAIAAALLIVLFAYLGTFRHQNGGICIGANPSSGTCQSFAHPTPPLGPGGEAVSDTYYFVHRALAGDGSITARVGKMTGLLQAGGGNGSGTSFGDMAGVHGAVQSWAKAGLIVTASTKPGSAYAAVMLTGAHGVRMQSDYTHDTAGPAVSADSARWLRLTRSGTTLTGYASANRRTWTKVATATLARLPQTVQAGLFVTSPQTAPTPQALVPGSGGEATGATALFDQLGLDGGWSPGGWSAHNVGDAGVLPTLTSVGYHRSGSGVTLTGSGDIAPSVGAGDTDRNALTGVFIGLIVLIVLGAMFITGEYRRGLIHTTLAASPQRGRVLIAKAIVIAAVAFLAGAAAAAVSIPLGNHILRTNGNFVYPASTLTQLRVILGTGALAALAGVLALALGAALRRGAGAVTAAIVLIVLPYTLAFAAALPAGAAQWLLRITPAAGFAIQQTLPQYHQVSYLYTPSEGFYPLAPGVGLAVLGGYALVALLVAHRLLRTRDA